MVVRRRRRGRFRRECGRRAFRMKAFNGGLVRGQLHPPTNSASPWNNHVLTVSWDSSSGPSPKCVSSLQVETALVHEIGLISTQTINMRVSRVDVWVPPAYASGDKNFIIFAPSDWTDKVTSCGSTSALNWYEAWGTAVQPAHIHYVWPKSIATQVIRSFSNVVLFQFSAPSVMHYLIKLHLQWRPSTPDPKPTHGVMASRHRSQPPPSSTLTTYVLDHDAVGSHQLCN